MGLQAEDLAFDSGITCDMCSESVNYGEDYVTHLSIGHNIYKNFNFFLNKARDSIKGGQKRKADVITLSDEEEEDSANNHEGPNVPQIDEDVKRRIVNVVEKTMSEMLDPIKKLLEGKVPLETDNLSTEDFDEDPAAADEKIWDAFNKLKMSINDLEFPEEMLQSFAMINSQQEEQKEKLQGTVTKKDGGKISDPHTFSQAQVRPCTARPRRTNTPVTSARGAKKIKKVKAETGA